MPTNNNLTRLGILLFSTIKNTSIYKMANKSIHSRNVHDLQFACERCWERDLPQRIDWENNSPVNHCDIPQEKMFNIIPKKHVGYRFHSWKFTINYTPTYPNDISPSLGYPLDILFHNPYGYAWARPPATSAAPPTPGPATGFRLFFGETMGLWWEYHGNMMGKSWECDGNMMGKSWEYDGNIMGIWWENHGNMMGKSWEYDGEIVGMWWEYDGKIMGIWWENHGLWWAYDGKIMGIWWEYDGGICLELYIYNHWKTQILHIILGSSIQLVRWDSTARQEVIS